LPTAFAPADDRIGGTNMTSTPHSILVATDFSEAGERAQTIAVSLARWFSAELHVIHVQVLLDDPHLAKEQRIEVERLLGTVEEEKREALEAPVRDPEVVMHTHLVRGVSAPEVIVGGCAQYGCDLIVMGTHGRRGITHFLLGSVAENVVRTSPVPVLTVRPDAVVPSHSIRRILVPHDFSSHSQQAVRIAAGWAGALEAEVTLLHAVEPVIYPEFYAVDLLPDEMVGRLRSRSEEALSAAATELLGDVKHRVVVRVGRAGDTIVAEANPEHYDLVIMGKRGLSAIEHLLLGSVAENVLKQSRVPMVAVRD
jgi:nucleotide-binding universal stress UspA family protein